MGNYKSTSGQLQNNTVNSAMSITINRVISLKISLIKANFKKIAKVIVMGLLKIGLIIVFKTQILKQ